jgi:predicted AlkP superfamily phosphohydrolase/phosphomutase
LNRSGSLALLALCALSGLLWAGYAPAASTGPAQMIVLGVDGLDPRLLADFMTRGDLPNIRRLIAQGGMRPLATSNPPQSPVAWSNFVTGMNPGGHGLFDFIALDRRTMQPYLSSTRVLPTGLAPLEIGSWRLPLGGERTVLLRQGTAFWELLEEGGVAVTIFQIPANYPPVATRGDSLSGMGTPDIRGSSGTFAFFSTSDDLEVGEVSGGQLIRFETRPDHLIARIPGPADPFRNDGRRVFADLRVHVDSERPIALIRTPDDEVLLEQGEWSDWIPLEFRMFASLVSVPGMVRLYLKRVHPQTELYVSPVNLDPRRPAQVISSPEDYAPRLAEAVGPFYTQEMPEETKALSAHVLSPDEFLSQSAIVLGERRRLLRFELDRFKRSDGDAFLFFYLSSVDQRHHMMARHSDPAHPAHAAQVPTSLRDAMDMTYREVDGIIGDIMAGIGPQTALVVMSDHGFSRFYRQAHLNTWLETNGYLVQSEPERRRDSDWLSSLDWSRTRAFSIGLNSLYINVKGRERDGIVPASQRLDLAREIASRLMEWRDQTTGKPVITAAVIREEAYRGPHLAEAPDVIVGYGDSFRASWATARGEVGKVLIEDNLDEWSGDHCVDPAIVPGVLISNLQLADEPRDLMDLTVGILRYFGVRPSPSMRGSPPF